MAVYSMTLQEVLELPNFELFDPDIPIIGYDNLKERIIENFLLQEINYGTPDYFRLKLNHNLKLRADNYNKMLKAQLIEIDPFVTEYLVSNEVGKINTDITNDGKTYDRLNSNTAKKQGKEVVGNEDYTAGGTTDTLKDGIQTNLTGKILSESDNRNITENEITAETDTLKSNENKDQTNVIDLTENISEKTDSTEVTAFVEDINTQIDTNVTEEYDKTGTNNQTARDWTEKGNSNAHNLSVRSDTPQAMLFNEPNHYYGTGRAHDYGVVRTDEKGNDYYTHYPEMEPNQIDQGSYKIGGGDTPYFNYASNADNRSGHDSYNKGGTETYSRNDTEKSNRKTVSDQTSTQNTDSDKDVKLDKDVTTDKTSNTNDKLNYDITKDETNNIDKTVNKGTLDSLSKNLQENVKEDNKLSEKEREINNSKYNKGNKNTTTLNDNTRLNVGKKQDVKNKTKEIEDSNKTNIKKGRSMRSPSQLLMEYRKTLTFNADMWLLSELKVCFLQIF